jgi:hypothetical protein
MRGLANRVGSVTQPEMGGSPAGCKRQHSQNGSGWADMEAKNCQFEWGEKNLQ